jgi:DNA-binding Xre family transcriptional regulator
VFKLCIQELLDAREKDMAWLARETGMSYQQIFTLTKVGVKRVGLDTLGFLCDVLECEINELLKREKEADSKPKGSKRRKSNT